MSSIDSRYKPAVTWQGSKTDIFQGTNFGGAFRSYLNTLGGPNEVASDMNGNFVIFGGSRADSNLKNGDEIGSYLIGGKGNDHLHALSGTNNFLLGGKGRDTFHLEYSPENGASAADDNNIIWDMNFGENDKIAIDGLAEIDPAKLTVSLAQKYNGFNTSDMFVVKYDGMRMAAVYVPGASNMDENAVNEMANKIKANIVPGNIFGNSSQFDSMLGGTDKTWHAPGTASLVLTNWDSSLNQKISLYPNELGVRDLKALFELPNREQNFDFSFTKLSPDDSLYVENGLYLHVSPHNTALKMISADIIFTPKPGQTLEQLAKELQTQFNLPPLGSENITSV